MYARPLVECASSVFTAEIPHVETRIVELLQPLEAQVADGQLHVTTFLKVVDGPVGDWQISLADAQLLAPEFEVGDEVGRAPTPAQCRAALSQTAPTSPLDEWLLQELTWWCVTRPAVTLAPLTLRAAAAWLEIPTPADHATLLLAGRKTPTAARDAEGPGWHWAQSRLHWMADTWADEEREFLESAVAAGAEPNSAASAWRDGYEAVFCVEAGGEISTLWVVDTRDDSPTRGACLDICLQEPFGVRRLVDPGQLLTLLKSFGHLLGDVPSSSEQGEAYAAFKSMSLNELIDWDYSEY